MKALSTVLVTWLLLSSIADEPGRRFVRGDYAAAAAEYRRLLARDPGSATLAYNLGTALLAEGRFEEARPLLERAAAADNPADVQQRAHYNLGNSYLYPAFAARVAGPVDRGAILRAVDAYRQALLLAPHDLDAKWNLELARRLLQVPPAPSGGGGGAPEPTGVASPQAAEGGEDAPQLSPSAAERLLSAVEQREVELQRQKLQKRQPPRPAH